MNLLLLTLLSASSFLIVTVSSAGLREEFTWTRINYLWPENSGRIRRQAKSLTNRGSDRISYGTDKDTSIVFVDSDNENFGRPGIGGQRPQGSGGPDPAIDYQYANNIPMGANVWRNKLFVTVPRRNEGISSTLNYVHLNSKSRHNVPLIPYPNWSSNIYPARRGNGNGQNFVSVYRVAVDDCDRLWFVDTGILEIPGGYGVIVYSLRENRSWRVTHNYFFLEANAGEFFVSGHNFQWNDGVFSVELTAPNNDGYRTLYFHSMAGTHMYRVSTRVLRNETLATRSYHANDFQSVGDRGSQSQTSSADLHKPSGVMLLGLVNQNALACWNTNNPLSTISIVQRDDRKMIYPCDVKIHNDHVYLLTNTMPEYLYGRLNYDEVNFRIWSNTVEKAIEGTACGTTLSG